MDRLPYGLVQTCIGDDKKCHTIDVPQSYQEAKQKHSAFFLTHPSRSKNAAIPICQKCITRVNKSKGNRHILRTQKSKKGKTKAAALKDENGKRVNNGHTSRWRQRFDIWSLGCQGGNTGDPNSNEWCPKGCDTTLQVGDKWFYDPATPIRSLQMSNGIVLAIRDDIVHAYRLGVV